MMKLIGAKRVFILAVLLAVNILLASVYFVYLSPMLGETRIQLARVEAEIAELSTKLENSQLEVAYMDENMPKYKKLHADGFFQNQDRFLMSRWLEDMRSKAQLSSFSFVIEDLKYFDDADAAAMNTRLAKSTITIKIAGVAFDTGVYALLQDIPVAFPAYTRLTNFQIKRRAEVNKQNLDAFAKGVQDGFIEANVNFDWFSLVPMAAGGVVDPNAPGTAPTGFEGR